MINVQTQLQIPTIKFKHLGKILPRRDMYSMSITLYAGHCALLLPLLLDLMGRSLPSLCRSQSWCRERTRGARAPGTIQLAGWAGEGGWEAVIYKCVCSGYCLRPRKEKQEGKSHSTQN